MSTKSCLNKRTDFDKDIPLFNIPNRKIYIEDNFDKVKDYNFVMIEGGEGMLKASKKLTDWLLIFRSPDFKEGNSPKLKLNLKEMFSIDIAQDRLSWFKKANG